MELLRILYLEESCEDFSRIITVVARSRPRWLLTRASTNKEFQALLRTTSYALILCNPTGKNVDSLKVLNWKMKHFPLIPLLFISDEVPCEVAWEAFQQGHAEIIPKSRVDLFLGVLDRVAPEMDGAPTERCASEGHFRGLTEKAPVIPWESDVATCRFTHVGEKATEILGYPIADWYSKDFWPNHIHPKDREWALDYCFESARTKSDYEFEYRMIARDGRTVWLQDIVSVVRDETGPRLLRGFMIDVTERKRVEELNCRMASVLECTTDFVSTCDKHGNVAYLNQAARRLLGIGDREELTSLQEETYQPAWATELKKKAMPIAVAQGVWMGEAALLHRTGKEIPVSLVMIAHRDSAGEVEYVSTIARDITELKLVEETLRTQARKLTTANDALARSAAELERFISVASHDLQEPLRMVTAHVQFLERKLGDRLEPDAKECMTFVVEGARRMHGLLNGLLKYAQAGNRRKEFQVVDLGSVVADVLRAYDPLIAGSEAKIFCGELPKVKGDAISLSLMFQNLLNNALKFRGGRSLEISVTAKATGDRWEVSVQDNGIGLDMQYSDKLFVIFERLHRNEEYAGAGVGLAICKKIAELHGGSIRVVSELGQGATFILSLPKAELAMHVRSRDQPQEMTARIS